PKTDSLLNVVWASAAPVFTARAVDGSSAQHTEEVSLRRPHRRVATRIFRTPNSELELVRPDHRKPSDRAVTFDWAGSDARHVGTVVHQWLFSIAGESDPVAALPARDVMIRNTASALSGLGVAKSEVSTAATRVVDVVSAGVECVAGRRIISNRHADSAAELALSVAGNNGSVERVVIDRVIRDDDSRLWIIDYKTSQHEGGGLDAFIRNECLRYRDQLSVYRRALTALYDSDAREIGELVTALYFPAYGRLEVVET
ncbi:MAG: PD-(D/E)XK nuclease family protein, partial [Pseudomonadota bacterium]